MTDATIDPSSLPRIRPIYYADADERTRKAYEELQLTSVENVILGTFMRNPDLTRAHSPFLAYIKDSTCLPVRQREIAILRNAWRCGADYQWEMHSQVGLSCGLSQEEIDRIPGGAGSPGWSPEEATLLSAVDELHDTCRIADDTWASLARHYDAAQLVEFLMLVGTYRAIAYVQNGAGIRPPTGKSPNIPGNRFLFAE